MPRIIQNLLLSAMKPSKHNIISKIKNSEAFFIVNLLSGNADILEPVKYQEFVSGMFTETDELITKGYLINENEEDRLYREKYYEFIETREKDEIQIFFVPWYSCNFACSYCYQDEYKAQTQKLSAGQIDAFFSTIEKQFAGKKKYITLFGGEPLLSGNYYKNTIDYIISSATQRQTDIAIVTNGYHIKEYIDILKKGNIREVQVTLDGTENTHNQRRYLKDHSPTFTRISEGIDLLIENKIAVNLRMVIDKNNINNLPDLAEYSIEKGWTTSSYFKTQIGRNYELHHCQKSAQKLYTRLDLYIDLYEQIKKYPQILEFHKPAFSISRFLFENGELPSPLFDSCPACKTEWAFDYSGYIYPCTATVGKKGEELGTYFPSVTLNSTQVCNWEERDVLSIAECKNCPVQLACGGGCGSIAKNQNGSILKPDCRPVKELIELGMSLYNPVNQ
jgi:uncharacterized protein